MTGHFRIPILAVLSLVGLLMLVPTRAAVPNSAAAPEAKWVRDFNGECSATGVGGGNTLLLPGEEISLTQFGAEQYNQN